MNQSRMSPWSWINIPIVCPPIYLVILPYLCWQWAPPRRSVARPGYRCSAPPLHGPGAGEAAATWAGAWCGLHSSPNLTSPILTPLYLTWVGSWCGPRTSPHLSPPHITSPHLTLSNLMHLHLNWGQSWCEHCTSPHLNSPQFTSSRLTSPHLSSPHLSRILVWTACLTAGGSLSTPCWNTNTHWKLLSRLGSNSSTWLVILSR